MGLLLNRNGQANAHCIYEWAYAKYTDGQKKRYSKILSCSACGSQTRAAQAYHYQNLESSLGDILICRFCVPSMLANENVYILTAVTIFFFFLIMNRKI